jgi:hypothetical protein
MSSTYLSTILGIGDRYDSAINYDTMNFKIIMIQ